MERYRYLEEFHKYDVDDLLTSGVKSDSVSINIDLRHLKEFKSALFDKIVKNVWREFSKWGQSLLELQKVIVQQSEYADSMNIKENCCVRFINLPLNPTKGKFPTLVDVGLFIEVRGIVAQASEISLPEIKREYSCTKCKRTFVVEADYEKMYSFNYPRGCLDPSGACPGSISRISSKNKNDYIVYQEITLQEQLKDSELKTVTVTLQDDLVRTVQPGEYITMCGTVERRFNLQRSKRTIVVLTMRAISIVREDERFKFSKNLCEQMILNRAKWEDHTDRLGQLNARDLIVKSISPEFYDMGLVKLSIALTLMKVSEFKLPNGSAIRGNSHLLLIGDAGVGKSKLIRFAPKIIQPSVLVSGTSSSAAGLTASAIKKNGAWHIEGGALVLADGGICCIDEFNFLPSSDKGALHEAMEQQFINFAKAGLVYKLNTRCSVIAEATRTQKLTQYDELPKSYGIGSALLSRFDLILVLNHTRDLDWNSKVADHILKRASNAPLDSDLWDLDQLKSYFLAAQEIEPQVTEAACKIISVYYNFCRADFLRDSSRTTIRLYESMMRLMISHAKLMFRDEVNVIDALTVIYLMEKSWGFGRLILSKKTVLEENYPLGPNEKQITEILKVLDLEESVESAIDLHRNMNSLTQISQADRATNIQRLREKFEFKNDANKLPKRNVSRNQKSDNNQPSTSRCYEPDNNQPTTSCGHKSNINLSHHFDDEEDELLSQLMDSTVEALEKSPEKENVNACEELPTKKVDVIPDYDLDFDDAVLEFDVPFSVNVDKENIPNAKTCSAIRNPEQPKTDQTPKIITPLKRSNEVNVETKKVKLSEKTLSKLSSFRNVEFEERRLPDNPPNETNNPRESELPSESSTAVDQAINFADDDDEDLKCLEFDF